MKVYLDMNSDVPLYQQIRNEVVVGLADGRLKANEILPSTRQMAADFGINFHTVNKAYGMLRQEGILRVNRKTGAVVSIEPPRDFRNEWNESARILLAEAFVKGMTAEEILSVCKSILGKFGEECENRG